MTIAAGKQIKDIKTISQVVVKQYIVSTHFIIYYPYQILNISSFDL